jgi:hypothetical protein
MSLDKQAVYWMKHPHYNDQQNILIYYVIFLRVTMLNVIMLSVIILNVFELFQP